MSGVREPPTSSTADFPFFFDAPHAALAERVRAVAATLAAQAEDPTVPLADQCRGVAHLLASAELFRVVLPASVGGAAETVDVRSVCLVREALAWASPLAEFVFAMQGLGSYPIVLAGTDAQKQAFLPQVRTGASLAAFAITEPEAGSDVAAMQTRAVRDGEQYVLEGGKTFISNAGFAGHYVVFAKTDTNAGSRGISAFVVTPDDPGFHFDGAIALLAEHPVGTLRFEGLRIPVSRRLGREGDGFRIAMATLDTFRSTVGAAAIGMARRGLDETLDRVRTRQQFGQPIADFQNTRNYLAEMATDIDAARLLIYRAAHAKDHGAARITREAAMAKMFATEAAQRVIDRAMQLHGASGLVHGHVIERLYREVRALRIYEGTTEIQRIVIAATLLPPTPPSTPRSSS